MRFCLLMQMNWLPRGSCPPSDSKTSLLCYSGGWVVETLFISFTNVQITGHKSHVCWVLESGIPEIALWLMAIFLSCFKCKDWRKGERIWCLDMKSKYFVLNLQRKTTRQISNTRRIFDWSLPIYFLQMEWTSDSLSGLLIARPKAIEMFCCEQRGKRHEGRGRRSHTDGRNK